MKKQEFIKSPSLHNGAEALVHHCAGLKPAEKVLIITDAATFKIGESIKEIAVSFGSVVTHVTVGNLNMHGQEPPDDVAEKMLTHQVIFGLTTMSMAHTLACQKALKNQARYLSLPDYSLELLASPSLQVDFLSLTPTVERLTDILTQGKVLKVTSELGTDVTINIAGRTANSAPGWCHAGGSLASPPDAESNIAPLEGESNGVIVIDGSIPCRDVGLLKEPLRVVIKQGQISEIHGPQSQTVSRVLDRLQNSKTRILGEVGFGLNPQAELKGVMLEDEGCLGTVHFGFGSNTLLGGRNQVPFHLDMVMRLPTVFVDDKKIYDKGRLISS